MDDETPSGPTQGTITRWRLLPEDYREGEQEFDWEYEPAPPLPDELAARLLREVASRL